MTQARPAENRTPGGSIPRIPKIIWTYWDKGFDSAPEVVVSSLRSWRVLNPGWTVHALDDTNLSDWMNPCALIPLYDQLPIQKRANLIRKYLISTHGGVWVDATTLCLEPIEQWLDLSPPSGFWLWKNDSTDRIICNWFIAGAPGNSFVTEWLASYRDFFSRPKNHRFGEKEKHRLAQYESALKTAESRSRFWNSWWARRLVGVYPYYISHYLAGYLLLCTRRFRSALTDGALMPQPGPLGLSDRIPLGPQFGQRYVENVRVTKPPMLKLSHRAIRESQLTQVLPGLMEIVTRRHRDLLAGEGV